MLIYLSVLPTDIITLLFLYFSPTQLLYLIPELHRWKISLTMMFWKAVWKKDISSFIELPKEYDEPYKSYDKYKEIFEILQDTTTNRVKYLAKNGYDILLYPRMIGEMYEAVIYAIEYGHIEIVKGCIDLGYVYYDNAMIHAAQCGNLDIVKLMVAKGADSYDDAMAFVALFNNNIDIIDFMLEKGATKYEWALHNAIGTKKIEIVQKMLDLIDKNIDRYSQDKLMEIYQRALAIGSLKNKKYQLIHDLLKKYQEKHCNNALS